MKRIATFAVIGALSTASLTACFSEGPMRGNDASLADYCDVSSTLVSSSSSLLPDMSDLAYEQASAGDMTAMHEWGESTSATIDEITADIRRVKPAAPTDEAAQALDGVLEALGVTSSLASAASNAPDLQTLLDALDSAVAQATNIAATMNAASDVIDQTYAEYCQ